MGTSENGVTVIPCEHGSVEPGDRFCTECGQSLTFAMNVKAHVKARWRANVLTLRAAVREVTHPRRPPCRTCGEGALVRRRQYRLSQPLPVIGEIITAPSFIGFLVGCAGCATIIAAGVGAPLIGASIFWGLIGLLLSTRKTVLQCSNRHCRATVAAS
jgi:hypothetical protein